MRPYDLLLTAVALLAVGSCAGNNALTANSCLDRCTHSDLTALERSTCELQCSQTASAPQPAPTPAPAPAATPTPAPAPAPTPAPVVSQPTQPRPATPTPTPTPTTSVVRPAAPSASWTSTPTTDPADVSRCQDSCNNASSSETDRATCRLNCSSQSTVVGAPSQTMVLHGNAPPPDPRGAVIRSSGNAVPPTTPPPSQQPVDPQRAAQCSNTAQQCANTCGSQLGPCTAQCDQERMSATDRATCKLTCETNTDVCVDECRQAEARCRGTKP